MIILKNKFFNQNVNKYFKYVVSCDFSAYTCPYCGTIGSLVKHGYYSRKIKIGNRIYTLIVLRIKCKECGKTHAVLPFFVVFYLLTSVNDAVMTACDELDISKCYSTKAKIKQAYTLWVNRILSFCSDITIALSDLHNLVT